VCTQKRIFEDIKPKARESHKDVNILPISLRNFDGWSPLQHCSSIIKRKWGFQSLIYMIFFYMEACKETRAFYQFCCCVVERI